MRNLKEKGKDKHAVKQCSASAGSICFLHKTYKALLGNIWLVNVSQYIIKLCYCKKKLHCGFTKGLICTTACHRAGSHQSTDFVPFIKICHLRQQVCIFKHANISSNYIFFLHCSFHLLIQIKETNYIALLMYVFYQSQSLKLSYFYIDL